MGFSERVWKSSPAKALTKRDCESASISKHFTKILRHTGHHESPGAVRWDHVLTSMPSAEQTQNRNPDNWIDTPSRSIDEPRLECCEDQNGTINCIRAVQGNSHGVSVSPTFYLWKIYRGLGKDTHSALAALPIVNEC